jgi:hypothetical protein
VFVSTGTGLGTPVLGYYAINWTLNEQTIKPGPSGATGPSSVYISFDDGAAIYEPDIINGTTGGAIMSRTITQTGSTMHHQSTSVNDYVDFNSIGTNNIQMTLNQIGYTGEGQTDIEYYNMSLHMVLLGPAGPTNVFSEVP